MVNIKKVEKKIEPLIVPYKDAHLKDIIEPDDFLKFLKEPLLKEKIDACLNQIR